MRRNAPRSTDEVLLADELVERARPHARSERRVGGRAGQVERLLGRPTWLDSTHGYGR